MQASELKPGDRVTISGKAYCVVVERSAPMLLPFNPYPDAVRVAVGASKDVHGGQDRTIHHVYSEHDSLFGPSCTHWQNCNHMPRTEITINPTTGEVVAPAPSWVEKLRGYVKRAQYNAEGPVLAEHLAQIASLIPAAPSSEEAADAEAATASDDAAAKYNELIMAVASKYPGESRHDTALRYIRLAETPQCNASQRKDTP